jgi:HD superfamily phosphohydrolase
MHAHRVFDRVHGEVSLPPLAAALAATPQFHRLDGIRQLGGAAFVFPSATHSRREHSIGVCHLAGRMARALQSQRPDLVDDDDVLCAELAGLLHDLGHASFSHLSEAHIRATLDPLWSHEDAGLVLLDATLAAHPEIDVAAHFARGTAAQHVAFVKLLVVGLADAARWPGEEAVGRPEAKRFLLQIVHNRTSGVDVDKIDYLLRDSLAVFGSNNAFDATRLMSAARVVAHDGAWTLAYDESVAHDLVELYALRTRLHRQVYQHRAVAVVEALLADLLGALDACLPEGEGLRACLADPDRFATLTDAWVLARPYATDPALAPARAAWESLFRRPWLTRLPLTACLCTAPACAACGACTAIPDAFCAACGASTRDRAAVVDDDPEGGGCPGLLVPPMCAITSAAATRELRRRAAPGVAPGAERFRGLRVHIVDVHCGAAAVVVDPHGHAWRDYNPLRALLFCARDGSVLRLRPTGFAVPEVRHTRVAHCYLPREASDEDVAAASAVFAAWAAEVGEVVEEGVCDV